MDPVWSKVHDSKDARTISRSRHCRAVPSDTTLEADCVGEVEFFAAKKNPLGLLCCIVVSSNCSIRLMDINVEVRFRITIDDDMIILIHALSDCCGQMK